MSDNLVEIDRAKIVNSGGSQYSRVPPALKRLFESEFGDSLIYKQAPGSKAVVIAIEKQEEK